MENKKFLHVAEEKFSDSFGKSSRIVSSKRPHASSSQYIYILEYSSIF